MRHLRGALLLGMLLCLWVGVAPPAEAQFANGYEFRRTIDIVDANVAGGPHANFPILISETLVDLRTVGNGGKVRNAAGHDIVFASDPNGSVPLAHELERYDPAPGEIVAWVRVESLSAASVLYVFYGNTSISTFQGNVTSNGVAGVWDNDFEGVWHLNEPTASTVLDVTANANHGTPVNNPAATSGQIGGALDFDTPPGLDVRVDVPATTSLDLSGYTHWTISAWVRPMICSWKKSPSRKNPSATGTAPMAMNTMKPL